MAKHMSKENSVAPKERINIKYVPATGDQVAEKELPLHMLVTGDFTGRSDDTAIEDRKPISINKYTFDDVMENAGIELEFGVPNTLVDDNSDLAINLKVSSLSDLSPDNIAQQVPELNKLLQLRESLVALKGPLGNKPAFRAQLQAILTDDVSREQLLKELELIAPKDNDK